MKKIRSIVAKILVVCMLVMAIPNVTAHAAIKTITEGTFKKVTSSNNYYKITIPGEGYVTLTASLSLKSGSPNATFTLLNSSKKKFAYNVDCSVSVDKNTKKASVKVPVSKGTYYINASWISTSSISVGDFYVKYQYTKTTQTSNYCKLNAIKIDPSKTYLAYQTPNGGYDRWYKFSFSTAKAVKIITNVSFNLYYSNGDRVTCEYDSASKAYKTAKLPAGTYFVRLRNSNDPGWASVDRFYWK